jgi:adenylate kinase family enzyme
MPDDSSEDFINFPFHSIGRSLRALAESEPKPLTENYAIKEAITAGEMVSKESLDKMLHTNLLQLINKKGIIIDGFPRDMDQILNFQEKVSGMKTVATI